MSTRLLIRGIILTWDNHKDEQGNITEVFQRISIDFAFSKYPDIRYVCSLIRPEELARKAVCDEHYRNKTSIYMIEMVIVRGRYIGKHHGWDTVEFEDRDEFIRILDQAQIDFDHEQPWKATVNYDKDGAYINFEHRLNHESQMY